MKNIRLYLVLLVFFISNNNYAQQVVQSVDPITLPLTGQNAFYMPASGNVTYISSQSIILKPGVTIQVIPGQVFEAKISSNVIEPAPINPSNDYNLNWVTNKAYDENNNVVSESKSFFDLNGKSLQNQWKDISRGHVLASQTLYDAYQRPVISTLVAPINNGGFSYKGDFVQNSTGANYTYQNFDLNKLNSPDPVGNTNKGTLGWYYSTNNNLDQYVSETDYPYSRSDFYGDGSGEGRRAANIGNQLKMGSGHETQSITLPVVNELNNYIAVRNKFFSVDSVGNLSTNLLNESYQSIGVNPNGQKGITISDRSGKTLMSARPGALFSVNNTVKINTYAYKYSLDPYSLSGGIGGSVDNIGLIGNGKIKVYNGANALLFSGPLNEYLPPVSLNGAGPSQKIVIYSNEPFDITYTGYLMPDCESCASQLTDPTVKASKFHYFSLLTPGSISATGDYELVNLVTEQPVIGPNLTDGSYKIRSKTDTEITLTYSNTFEDISYNFYNQLGQLIATIAPEGVKQLIDNMNAFTKKEDIPFSMFYNYDAQGRLIKVKVWEGGTVEYAYRRDGKIRFSQNSLQVIKKSFSYNNYDQLGRTTESGEYVYGTTGTNFVSAKNSSTILESIAIDGGLANFSALKTDYVKTEYDIVSKSVNTVVSGYIQEFTTGSVAYTQNTNSETWYSYDDQGRLTWRIQNIVGLGAKTIDYTYDFNGNVLQVVCQKDVLAERFYHHYEYDLDKRLTAVYTSKDGNSKTLEAKYYHYLHGPLKRVELAENLQGIDYTYTPQGWLKTINHPSTVDENDPGRDGVVNPFAKDAFGLSLEYFPGDFYRRGSNISSVNTGITIRYNGNIGGSIWKSRNMNTSSPIVGPNMMIYNYDDKYQLNETTFGTPNFSSSTFTADLVNKFKETFSYRDSHGNFDVLTRRNSVGLITDDFKYNYKSNISNQLKSIENRNAPNTYYAQYDYNMLGQMERQTKGNVDWFVKYDIMGRIVGIYSDKDYTVKKVIYTYDETGQRISKKDYVLNRTTFYISDLAGNTIAIYEASGADVPSNIAMKEVPIYGADRLGTYYCADNLRVYELKDQLGSVRAVVKRNKIGGQVETFSYGDYYAFGSTTQNGGDYRYDYQGQYAEKDKETDWNSFDLRMYDARIGRWLSVDPKSQYWSPYIGMGNDPISGVDPDGGFEKRIWAALYSAFNGGDIVHNGEEWQVNTKGDNFVYEGQVYTETVAHFNFKSEFVATGSAKLTFGIQAGFNGTYGKLEGGIATFDVAEANYDFMKQSGGAGWSEKKMHNFISGSVKVTDIVSVGGKYDYNFKYYDGMEGLHRIDGTDSHDREGNISVFKFGPKLAAGPVISVQNKVNIISQQKGGENFVGLDIGAGVKLILGIDVKAKIGIIVR